MNDTENSLDAEETNGVYLLEVFSRPNQSDLTYKVQSATGEAWVRSVRFNDQYIGIDDRAEFECQDFEISDDDVLEVTVGGSDTSRTLVERIYEFNQQFDYGEYHHDPHFWLSALEHQIDEAWDAYEAGDEAHAYREAADAVLVAFQFMRSCGDSAPQHYVLERIVNAEDRGIAEEIVPKYIDWYEGLMDETGPSSTETAQDGGADE